MDLLGSILGKMDAPPSVPVDEETKEKVKGTIFLDQCCIACHSGVKKVKLGLE